MLGVVFLAVGGSTGPHPSTHLLQRTSWLPFATFPESPKLEANSTRHR